MKFYISDLHLGHKNIIGFDSRPFFTLQEMEDTIISNWNSVVSKNDEVCIIGDMFWKNEGADEILDRLNGKKYLILGNHDRLNAEMTKRFVWIKEIETISDGDLHVVLCHYPIAHWKNQSYGYVHLYGHIHRSRDSKPYEEYGKMRRELGIDFQAYNVGCMCEKMNYTPKTLAEIMK